MDSTLKVTYFAGKGSGEVIRFLLKYGEVEFEDVRIEMADWPSIKPSTPFGQLPLLESNGKVVGQSLAICRYIAKKVKLVGRNDWEDLEIDAIADTINDVRSKLLSLFYEKDTEAKKKLREIAIKETIPYYYEKFDQIAKENNGHLALNKLTWADFLFTTNNDAVTFLVEEDPLKTYPNLVKVVNNVISIPAVKNWIETRPKSLF